MRSFSLTRRLITAVLLVELCSTLLLLVSAGVYESVSRFRAFDVMLRGRADSLLGAVQDAGDEQDNVMLDGSQLTSPKRDIYAVREEHGRVLGQSPNWPDVEAAFDDITTDFHTTSIHHQTYRVIRLAGLRTVDPGEKGGVPRHIIVLYGSRTHPVWESVFHAVAFYAALSLSLLALSAFIMLKLLRAGLQPLRELAGEASQISVHSWNFQPSTQVLQVRELAPLALALEITLAGLERSFNQQRQFIGDAAHELKTAVSVIKSSLQVLTIRDRTGPEYRAGVERAERDCERMEELVASMLTLAAVEANVPDKQQALPIDLCALLADVLAQFHPASELSGVATRLQCDSLAWVSGNPEKLRLLCSNLIHNALQHSPSGSEVRAVVRWCDAQVEMRIEDDGEGISVDALPYVFDRFYRGDASRSRRTGGTGLGLAISKAIVEALRGRIEIESELGRGTHVVVTLPASEPKPSGSLKVFL